MEEINKTLHFKKDKSKKKRGADFGLKILAVILAVIVWFVLSTLGYGNIHPLLS